MYRILTPWGKEEGTLNSMNGIWKDPPILSPRRGYCGKYSFIIIENEMSNYARPIEQIP